MSAKPEPKPIHYDHAAYRADWQQVVMNQGPPCFYLGDDPDRFCLRAERWDGHRDKDEYPEHRFVSLAALLDNVRAEAYDLGRAEKDKEWFDAIEAWRVPESLPDCPACAAFEVAFDARKGREDRR